MDKGVTDDGVSQETRLSLCRVTSPGGAWASGPALEGTLQAGGTTPSPWESPGCADLVPGNPTLRLRCRPHCGSPLWPQPLSLPSWTEGAEAEGEPALGSRRHSSQAFGWVWVSAET